MSHKEQYAIQAKGYAGAVRYTGHAREILKRAGKKDCYYDDRKQVRMAGGAVYNSALTALNAYLTLLC
ncbi:MAG: DUF5618 family protein [Dysgonamonadaceae bacterium]|nr:DUF5618 family protein [Dysgonamonadaceae bacterium]